MEIPEYIEVIKMQNQDLLFFIFSLSVFSVYLGATFYFTYRRREKLKVVLRSLGESLGLDDVNIKPGIYVPLYTVAGIYEGIGLEIELKAVERNVPHEITVSLQVASAFSLRIYPEDLNEKLEKLVGVISEIETGVPSFDCRFVIQSDNPSQAVSFLSSAENRDMIDSMINAGIKYIDIGKGRTAIKLSMFDPESSLRPDRIKSILADLMTLSRKLS